MPGTKKWVSPVNWRANNPGAMDASKRIRGDLHGTLATVPERRQTSMKKKPKKSIPKSRSTFTPESFVEQLAFDVPGFAKETREVQAAVAGIIWIGACSDRDHSIHEGYWSFHHTEIAAAFGRKFNEINGRLAFFDVYGKWRFASKFFGEDGFTKGYRLTARFQASLDMILANRDPKMTRLMDARGLKYRTLPKAVASQDMSGVTTNRWKAANEDDCVLKLVPVNIPEILKLLDVTEEKITNWRRREHPSGDPIFEDDPDLDYLEDLRLSALKLVVVAQTDIGGPGKVMHRYVESESGRLYATGTANLQNARKILRHAALSGFWDYDIENCHFSIIAHMAAHAGFRCCAIENYIANKAQVRTDIAQAVGITIDETKRCLIALMYGAKTTSWYENAIPRTIGAGAARRLNESPVFSAIAEDVKNAGARILATTEPNRQGGLVNAFGKSLQGGNPSQRLAHLIQGVEAQALRACFVLHPDSIMLLQHDGFTSTRQLDATPMEMAMKRITGYTFELAEKRISPDISSLNTRGNRPSFQKC